jgi:hypothetical protein
MGRKFGQDPFDHHLFIVDIDLCGKIRGTTFRFNAQIKTRLGFGSLGVTISDQIVAS